VAESNYEIFNTIIQSISDIFLQHTFSSFNLMI